MPTPLRRLSVVTVTYNSAGMVARSLASAAAAAANVGLEIEMIVVDNASVDGSADVVRAAFPEAHLVANTENVGFGRANNQAFDLASGDLWLLLNPDAALDPDALVPLLELLDDRPRAGAVAPRVLTPGRGGPESGGMSPGIRSAVGHFLFVNRLLWRDRGGPWRGVVLHPRPRLGPRRVDWLAAAVLLVRPEAMRAVGGFDERFFLYGEDVDLGERLGRTGWELWTVPAGTATHLLGGSQGGTSTRWVDDGYRTYAARASGPELAAFNVVMALGLSVRALVWRHVDGTPDGRLRARNVQLGARRAWRAAWRSLFGTGSRPRAQEGAALPARGPR